MSNHRVGGLFPPQSPEREQILSLLRKEPVLPEPTSQYVSKPRWTLLLLQWLCICFVNLKTTSGICRRLKSLGITYKRGRYHITSPDPEYDEKLAWIQAVESLAKRPEQNAVVLYGDEKTYYKQAKLGFGYARVGRGGVNQPTVESYPKKNTKARIAGFINRETGQLITQIRSKMGVEGLCHCMYKIRQEIGISKTIYLIWDNWPIHKHKSVMEAAHINDIKILWLPTYAPWTNPIEKVWHKLNKDVLVMHKYRDLWQELKQKVQQWLAQYATPSPDLLRYIGLGSV